MVLVLIIFKISFWAVPDFIRVLPVNTSGPTIGHIDVSAFSKMAALGLHAMAPVKQPSDRANSKAPLTYGVRPLAEMPMTVSF